MIAKAVGGASSRSEGIAACSVHTARYPVRRCRADVPTGRALLRAVRYKLWPKLLSNPLGGHHERYTEIAWDIASRRPDVIVTGTNPVVTAFECNDGGA